MDKQKILEYIEMLAITKKKISSVIHENLNTEFDKVWYKHLLATQGSLTTTIQCLERELKEK